MATPTSRIRVPAPAARAAAAAASATPAPRPASATTARRPSGPPAVTLSPRAPAAGPPGGERLAAPGGPGEALPAEVRAALEWSFDAPLAGVRVHRDESAAAAAAALGARAFTYGPHVFLGPREQPTDLRLMAHEVAHVVQQGAAPTPQRLAPGQGDAYEGEAERAAAAAERGVRFAVRERTSGPRVQALGLSDILDGLAELAANLPGFTLLTFIIGRNPINMRPVERNFTNLLRGFMGLIVGGEVLFQVLNRYGVVERIGRWVSDQVASLGLSYEYLRGRFNAFTDSLSWRDIFSPGDVWRRAQAIFAEPIGRIRAFITQLVSQAVTWLKETFMQPLSNFCREIPGYTLVTVLLGRDPFTNAPVQRTPLNLVRAFAEFIPGGTEKVNQLVESRALQRAYEWFIAETQARNLTWARVTGTFAQAWNSLRLEDVLHPIDTIARVANIFRPLMGDLVGFAGAALMKLLELIFEAAMGAGGARILAIFRRARDTFQTIIRDPVRFLRNLLGAVGQGVRQFMRNILRHLQQGVIAWLTGPVARAGVQMPERWDLRGIIWFVLQILGLTWDRIRQKLVRLMGERAVSLLEAGFQLLQEIRQRGLVQALRDRVTEFFGQLREAALGSIRNFIQQRLVMAGITQLLSLLNPVGAVIQAIIKTYTTIQFFIQRINQILDLVESIVDSISSIASGAIGQAADFVERTMARTIPVILDFLARFIGLGDVGGQVQRTIQSLQARVDQMLDRAVDWIRTMTQRLAQAAASAARSVGQRILGWLGLRREFQTEDGERHSLYFERRGGEVQLMRASDLPTEIRTYLNTLPNYTKNPKKAALAEAKGLVQVLNPKIRLITRDIPPAGATGPPMTAPAEEQEIIRNVTRLSELLRVLFGLDDVTIPQLPPVKWGAPVPSPTAPAQTPKQKSEVEQLSSASARGGSAARGDTPESLYLTGKQPRWVKMHLIPYSVGGRGDPDNWVPAPESVNQSGPVRNSFEASLESAVRSAAVSGPGMQPRARRATLPSVVWVVSEVTRYKPPMSHGGQTLNFPDQVRLRFGLHRPPDASGGDWPKFSAPVSDQTVNIPPLPDSSIRLMSSTGTTMRNSGLPHLTDPVYGESLINAIKRARSATSFSTWPEFQTALLAATTHVPSLPPAKVALIVNDFENGAAFTGKIFPS